MHADHVHILTQKVYSGPNPKRENYGRQHITKIRENNSHKVTEVNEQLGLSQINGRIY